MTPLDSPVAPLNYSSPPGGGPGPAGWTLGRFGVRLSPDQQAVADRYFARGHVFAVMGGRGSGKTFLLAYLAACELADGRVVAYVNAIGAAPALRHGFIRAVGGLLGPAAAREAVDGHRLVFPGPADLGVPGVAVWLVDNLWERNGSLIRPSSARFAAVGDLPAGTLVLAGPPVRPLFADYPPAAPSGPDDPAPFVVAAG